MTTAIIGGTGFIGTALVERLLLRGVAPVVISRGKRPVTLPEGVAHKAADRADTARLVDIFRGHGVDTVIDIFALSMPNTAPVLEAMGAIGGRYVLISSVDVYRNYDGLLRKGQPPVQQQPAREDDPLRTLRYPFRQNESSRDNAAADPFNDYDKIVIEEAALADTRFATTVLRLPMIFGPGDRQRRFAWAIDAVKAGGVIPLDERAARWSNSYGYIADIAEGIALAAHHPKAADRIYNIGQNFVRTPLEWLLTFGVVMGKRIEVETVGPARKGLLWDTAESSDLRYPLTIDTTRIREELGFTEPTAELDALRAAVADEERRSR